jgi:pSer/pThr/pTyr-binding forkhead associated (FHA) protein
MGPSFQIVLRSGPTPGKTYPLVKSEIFIGRDLSNDIVINDPEISRRHARLYIQNGAFVLEDLGSTNGSSVNGQRLVSPYTLHPDEVITLGERITLVFEAVELEESTTVSTSSLKQPITVQPDAVKMPPPVSAPAYPPPTPSYEPPPAPRPRPVSQPEPVQHYPPVSPPTYQVPPPAAQQQYPQQQPRYQPMPQAPAYEPEQTPFAGQVPYPVEIETPQPRVKAPIWPFIVIGILLLIILVLVIDDFSLWCPLFGMC